MTLTFVDPKAPPTQNILLYGPPGTGKTVGACSAPGPILLLNAEGADGAFKARQLHADTEIREVPFENRQTLNEVYRYVLEGNGVRTVVVDSIGEIYRKLLEQLGGERATLQVYGDVNTIIERFVRSLRDLPVHVVLIAHEKVDDAEDDRIVRPATGGKQLPEIVMAMMSIVGYCGVVPETEDSPRRYVAQLVEDRGRRAKSRWPELGKVQDLNVTGWLTIINGTYAAAARDEKPKRSRRKKADAEPEANGNGAGATEQQAELATA